VLVVAARSAATCIKTSTRLKTNYLLLGQKLTILLGQKFSEKISLKTKKVKNFSWRGI
jgi:hypothetical protein